jgi:hypothetical protein
MWIAWWGPVAYYLGLLAETRERHDEAAVHFARAASLSESVGAPTWLRNAELGQARVS